MLVHDHNNRAAVRIRILTVAAAILTAAVFALPLVIPVIVDAQTKADCLACHSDASLSMTRGGRKQSLYVDDALLSRSPHKDLQCVMCHSGFDASKTPHKANIERVNCLDCHGDAQEKHPRHGGILQALKTPGEKVAACKSCHGRHDVNLGRGDGCAKCHSDVKAAFDASAHGRALSAGAASAPTCLGCHSSNLVPANDGVDKLKVKTAQTQKCLSCHLDNPDVRARTTPTAGFIASYETSVHGKALARGNAAAANCVDCHGAHEMRKGIDPASRVSQQRTPETCGKCHGDIAKQYRESIHGSALARGVRDAPACTDCHGEHNILRHTDPRSPVAAQNVSAQVCSTCHSSVALTSKFGIRSDRFQTFSDSYHGLAMRGGSANVANCASCHGVHNIKPSSDPTSTINPANLATTCGKCHPGANVRFATGRVHVVTTARRAPVLFFISALYIVLIVGTIGGMVAHNVVDFYRKSKVHLGMRRGEIPHIPPGHGLYLRMSACERLQHGTLMVSFITLALTGFMLRYPDAFWVDWTRRMLGPLYAYRGGIHRIAGATLIGSGLWHLIYLFVTERGRQLFRDIMVRPADLGEAIGVAKFNLGLSKVKPKLDRFSYVEKSEYWAMIWGTIIMGGTGIIMWFDNTFMRLITKLGWDVARTIHFYEAWLAVLAILVWHMYFVIFNPDIYPMNLAWLRGTLSEEEMAEDHPAELERLKAEREQKTAPAKPS